MNFGQIYAFIHRIKARSAFPLPRRNAQLCVCPDSPLLWFIDILWKFFEIWTCKSCWKEKFLKFLSFWMLQGISLFSIFFYTFSHRWTIVSLSIKVKKKKVLREIFITIYRISSSIIVVRDIFKVSSKHPPSSRMNKLNWSWKIGRFLEIKKMYARKV